LKYSIFLIFLKKFILLSLNSFFFKEFFDIFRNEIDLYFTEKKKSKANDNKWLKLIEKVKEIESFTYQQLATNVNKINVEISDEMRKNIEQIESQISNLDSDSTEEQINSLKDEIDEQKFKIESILFDNKTYFFMKDCKIKKKNYTFLMIINDVYISKNDIFRCVMVNGSISDKIENTDDLDDSDDLSYMQQAEKCLYQKKVLTKKILNKILISKILLKKTISNIMVFNIYDIVELDLELKRLKSIDENTFHGLTDLKVLKLRYNVLEKIPNLSGLTNLKVLSLNSNQIDSIDPNAFHGLNLQQLDLGSNVLEEINLNIPSLKVLDLGSNCIKNINPNTFQNVASLQSLNLEQNYIKSLEDNTFVCLPNLKYLNLCLNEIEKINSNTFSGLNELIGLEISDCKINEFDDEALQHLTSLELLDISQKDTQDEDRDMQKLKISSKMLSGLVNLTDLNISWVKIESIEENSFKNLTKLEELDIMFSKFDSKINKNIFSDLTSLKNLMCSKGQEKFIDQLKLKNLKMKIDMCRD